MLRRRGFGLPRTAGRFAATFGVGVGIAIGWELLSILMAHWSIMISNNDADGDPDSDPDPDDSSLLIPDCNGIDGAPYRQSLTGSHGQRPWF